MCYYSHMSDKGLSLETVLMTAQVKTYPDPAVVLMKTALRMRKAYDLRFAEFAEILGVSAAQLRRYTEETTFSSQGTRQRAAMFVRAVRSLEALVGENVERAKAWLNSINSDLGGDRPIDCLKTIEGMTDVVRYLDAMRGA